MGVVKSEGGPRVPPCLNYGGGGRTSGLIPRMDQPPATKKDFGTDSVMTARANPNQSQKNVERQAPPTITYFDSALQVKTDQIPARMLKTGATDTSGNPRRTIMGRK